MMSNPKTNSCECVSLSSSSILLTSSLIYSNSNIKVELPSQNESVSNLNNAASKVDSEQFTLSLYSPTVISSPSPSPLCEVCGDISSGFHCGAFICEACKKFFVRCLRLKNEFKSECLQGGKCEITKTTRTQCPQCRFNKCISLNMYGPGGRNVSEEINHIPCKVCGAPSSGFHFGAITCEGCKGFYRRCIKERNLSKYHCNQGGTCEVTWKTRNICKFCRYKRCTDIGMMPEKSRIGRQPNLVKHKTQMEVNQFKMAKNQTLKNECKILKVADKVNSNPKLTMGKRTPFNDKLSENLKFSRSIEGKHLDRDVNIRSLISNASCCDEYCLKNDGGGASNELKFKKTNINLDNEAPQRENFHLNAISNENVFSPQNNMLKMQQMRNKNEIEDEDEDESNNKWLYNMNDMIYTNDLLQKGNINKCAMSKCCHILEKNGSNETIIDLNNIFKKDASSQMKSMTLTSKVDEHLLLNCMPGSFNKCEYVRNDQDSFPNMDQFHDTTFTSNLSSVISKMDIISSASSNETKMITSFNRSILPLLPKPSTSSSSSTAASSSTEVHLSHLIPCCYKDGVACYWDDDVALLPDDVHVPQNRICFQTDLKIPKDKAHKLKLLQEICKLYAFRYLPLNSINMIMDLRQKNSSDLKNNDNMGSSKCECISCKFENYRSEEGCSDLSHVTHESDMKTLHSQKSFETKYGKVHNEPKLNYSTSDLVMRESSFTYNQVTGVTLQLYDILKPIAELAPVRIYRDMAMEESFNCQMSKFTYNAKCVLAFAKKVPGFRTFSLPMQIDMIQRCMYPIVTMILAKAYNSGNKLFYFGFTEEERAIIYEHFYMFKKLGQNLIDLGNICKTYNLDDVEIAFLCAIHLIDLGDRHVHKELLIDSLECYVKNKHGPHSIRHMYLLRLLRVMNVSMQVHNECMTTFFTDPLFANIPIPQLFMETFKSLDDDL